MCPIRFASALCEPNRRCLCIIREEMGSAEGDGGMFGMVRIGIALGLVLAGSVAIVGPTVADSSLVPETDPFCDVLGEVAAFGGYVNRCVDLSTTEVREDKNSNRLTYDGLGWVNMGFDDVPGPSECVPGREVREDGWAWRCEVKNDQHQLVKISRWRRPVQMEFAHTKSPGKSTIILSSNTSLTGCRLSASNSRLLAGQQAKLTGQSARRTLSTSSIPKGKVTIRVTCPDRRMNSSSDLLVRAKGSALLRSDCLDAWHDGKYGDVVPGYGRRMTTEMATRTTAECSALTPLTSDEYQRVGRQAYLKIGQIAEREVRRVSASRGIPICQAVTEVFKPVDNAGYRVDPWPHPNLEAPVPIAGYLPDGYFPVLFRQWQEGPVRMDMIADCSSGIQSMRLVAGTWGQCKLQGLSLTLPDGHQMYPVHTFDRGGCPSSYPVNEISQTAVCIVWGDRIGNNTIGGTGKVFATSGTQVSAGEKTNSTTDLIYDCQDRALREGQFANVGVDLAPTLR